MVPIDRETVASKLTKLQLAVNVLEELGAVPEQEFVRDAKTNGAAMFNLVISIELIVDVGNHILAEAFQKPAKTYRDVILALGEAGVIPHEFAEAQQEMTDFRNKLIHDYSTVNLKNVYRYTQQAPMIFRQFAAYFADFAGL